CMNLVSCPRNSRYIVAIKMGRRQGGPSRTGVKGAYLNRYVTDEQRGRQPIFITTLWAGASWLFFRVARSTRMTQIWVLRSRLEKQPTDLRQYTCYSGDRTLGPSTSRAVLPAKKRLFSTGIKGQVKYRGSARLWIQTMKSPLQVKRSTHDLPWSTTMLHLSESDLRFLVETVATHRRDYDHIVNLIREKDTRGQSTNPDRRPSESSLCSSR